MADNRFPWNTSEQIADDSHPRFETPGGAQVKADQARDAAILVAETALTEHELTGTGAHPTATPTTDGFQSAADKAKLNGIEAGANKYIHPATHPPSIITQDQNNRFVTDAEKAVWADKPTKQEFAAHTGDTTIHVTTADKDNWNSKASGNHTHPNATPTTPGFESAEDKTKLDNSTNAATPNTLMQRDAAGRAKVSAPSASTDIARKKEVDDVQANLDMHTGNGVIHITQAERERWNSNTGGGGGTAFTGNFLSRINGINATQQYDGIDLVAGANIQLEQDIANKRITIIASINSGGGGTVGEGGFPEGYTITGDNVTDDGPELARYIGDAIAAGKKDIVIPEAQVAYYSANTQILIAEDGVTVRGYGEKSHIRFGFDDRPPFIFNQTEDSVYDNIKLSSKNTNRVAPFKGLLTFNQCVRFRVSKFKCDKSAAVGIFVDGSSDGVIDRPRIMNTNADGIHVVDGSTNVIVQSAHTYNTGDDAISTVSPQTGGTPCDGIFFVNCFINRSQARGMTNVGSRNVIMIGNKVKDTASSNFLVAEDSGYGTFRPTRTLISNCRGQNAGRITPDDTTRNTGNHCGLEIVSSTFTIVSDCQFENAEQRGVVAQTNAESVIMDNVQSDGNNISGFHLSAPGMIGSNLRASGNLEQGLLFVNMSGFSQFTNIRAVDNGATYDNIYVTGCADVTIDNIVSLDNRTPQTIDRAIEINNSNRIKIGRLTMNKGTRLFFSGTNTAIEVDRFELTAIPDATSFGMFKVGQICYYMNGTSTSTYVWNGTAWIKQLGTNDLNNTVTSTSTTQPATANAAKLAYDRADAAFTAASNGKVLVRDAITGKGGTVADADADGFPTFQELATGVGTIPSGVFGSIRSIYSKVPSASPGDVVVTFPAGLSSFITSAYEINSDQLSFRAYTLSISHLALSDGTTTIRLVLANTSTDTIVNMLSINLKTKKAYAYAVTPSFSADKFKEIDISTLNLTKALTVRAIGASNTGINANVMWYYA